LREKIRDGYLDEAGAIFKPSGRCCKRSPKLRGKLPISKFLADSLSMKRVQMLEETIGDRTTDKIYLHPDRPLPIVRPSLVRALKNNV
jgi:hypothetical protein